MNKVHTFKIEIDWKLISEISRIDRFDASWTSIENREGQSLKQLKSVATVKSVGASTRIEGSKMNDEEVDVLLQSLSIEKLIDRDSQEVAGYHDVLETICEVYNDIDITENSIKSLHNLLLRYSEKDLWHKGNYKQHRNSVEARMPDGSTQIVFVTTSPGIETEDEMRNLVEWYNTDKSTHPLVKCALFAYEFVSIHPFQDGNGRLSRLLTTLVLLKNGYRWIQYISFESEIEDRKTEYYWELRRCQAQRPGEDVTSWIYFFLSALKDIQVKLEKKLETTGTLTKLDPKEKSILAFISDHPGTKSGLISAKLGLPSPTVKRLLNNLVNKNLIERFGTGPGTNYSIK